MRLSSKTDKELSEIISAVIKEQNRRRKLDVSPEKIEAAIAAYQKESGAGEGEPWEQPTSALDAYRKGAVVEHDGKQWVSTVANNVWKPGVSGWREQAEDGSAPPYAPPTGAHDAYMTGEQVTYDGKVYEAVRDGVVHSPSEYPADWRLVAEDEDEGPEPEPEEPPEEEEPDPEEPTDPEEPEPGDGDDGDDEVPEWVPAGHSYAAGDLVSYQGTVYRVVQGHTSQSHWTPDTVASLYEVVEES